MRTSVLVGFVLGALLVAGWYFVPTVMDDAARTNALEAAQQAELARRQLDRYSSMATTAAKHLDSGAMLSDGDFQKYSEIAEAAAAAHATQFEGIDSPPPPPPTATAEAMRSGVQAFNSHKPINTAYLDDAISNTRQAAQLVRGQPIAHVALIQGAALLMDAHNKLRDAQRARVAVEVALNQAFKFAIRERYQRNRQNYYSELDTDPIITDLRTGEFGQSELEAQLEATKAELASVAEQLNSRAEQLELVSAQLAQAQQERLQLEARRAEGGIGFNAFRSSYGGVMQRLAELQVQEELLTHGGLRGAEVDAANPVSGPISGGEPVRGAVELAADKTRLEAVRERLVGAIEEIDSQVKQVEKSAELNDAAAANYGSRAGQYKEAVINAQGTLGELTSNAVRLETEALKAARDARGAFEQADRAIADFKREARTVQSDRDPERQNQRLRAILADQLVDQIGKTAEAAARVLEARILLLRLESVERQRVMLEQIARLAAGELTDERTLTDLIAAARKEGLDTLNAAIDIYADLASDEDATVWVNLAGHGTAVYLKSRFDSVQGPDLAFEAARIMQTAVEGREQSPYLAKHVLFRDYLADRTDFSPGGADMGTDDPNAATGDDPNTAADPNTPDTEDDPFGDNDDDPFGG